MKKKFFAAILALMVLFAAGCSEQPEDATGADWQPPRRGETALPEVTPESTPKPTPTEVSEKKPETEATGTPVPAEEAEPVVVLGQYIRLALTKLSKTELQEEVQAILREYAEFVEVERSAQIGDTLDITYTVEVDGTLLEDGTPSQNIVTIGEGMYIPGFEDGLIGASAGDIVELDLDFPDPYIINPELAGKAALFVITVDNVMETQIPELTDEFVKEYFGYETAADYLADAEEAFNQQSLDAQLLEMILDSSEIEEYPMDRIAEEKKGFVDYYVSYADYYGSFYDVDTETALQAFFGFASMEELEEIGETYAYTQVKKDLVLNAIAKKEYLTLSDEEYEARLWQYAAGYGYSTTEDFLIDYNEEEIRKEIFYDYVLDWCMRSAVVYNAEN